MVGSNTHREVASRGEWALGGSRTTRRGSCRYFRRESCRHFRRGSCRHLPLLQQQWLSLYLALSLERDDTLEQEERWRDYEPFRILRGKQGTPSTEQSQRLACAGRRVNALLVQDRQEERVQAKTNGRCRPWDKRQEKSPTQTEGGSRDTGAGTRGVGHGGEISRRHSGGAYL